MIIRILWAGVAMLRSIPPEAVLLEFLEDLSEVVQDREPIVLVLRGSLLLRHWFAESARPAADIDLECFEREKGKRGQRYTSLVDHGRGLCCYVVEHDASRSASRDVVFNPLDPPGDGESLWEYGSPGERYYLGWSQIRRGERSGRLQIDIAAADLYDLEEISVFDIHLVSTRARTFRFPAYTPEMMLAAKLSWLIRGFTWRGASKSYGAHAWTGEMKDLFDSHLILTNAEIRCDLLQKCLMVVGRDDAVDLGNLEALFGPQRTKLTDGDFSNWSEFRRQHEERITSGPAEMLHTIANHLEPMLGKSWRRTDWHAK
jgi:hypothetical protein